MNKSSGGDGIPVELFQTLKDNALKVLHSIYQQIWKTQQCPQDWKRSVFIPTPKKGNAKEYSNYRTVALISHASTEKAMVPHSNTLAWKIPWTEEPGGLPSMGSHRVGHDWSDLAAAAHASNVILEILQARLQQYITINLQMFKLNLEKAEESEIKLPTSIGSLKKAREFQKNIYFCFIDYAKAFDCVDHNKLWKILEEMRIPDHLTCLLRNRYAGQEATVRTGH